MSKVLEKKQQVVADVKEKLTASVSTVVTDYRGLSVAEVTELRKQLREAGVEYRVLKNTLVRRATGEIGLSDMDQFLTGPTAIAFSKDDVVAPAKVLHNFAKEHKNLEIKGAIVEGAIVGPEKVEEIASLPSREGLLSMLLSVLQAPVRNFAYSVKAVAEQKEQTETASAE
ncbi:50S ribosomal protein L10 [Shimazuella kribbensis]|uniref:50S ribosomal protein L10 n=1 Tax=Shimazuella kribbensis TaxID=139808 RepID=UPI000422D3CB|nr:50S ribosomal protein L10 [Shimazuella kribbensis]